MPTSAEQQAGVSLLSAKPAAHDHPRRPSRPLPRNREVCNRPRRGCGVRGRTGSRAAHRSAVLRRSDAARDPGAAGFRGTACNAGGRRLSAAMRRRARETPDKARFERQHRWRRICLRTHRRRCSRRHASGDSGGDARARRRDVRRAVGFQRTARTYHRRAALSLAAGRNARAGSGRSAKLADARSR